MPTHLIPLWQRAGEVQELLTILTRPVISKLVQAMLAKYGSLISVKSGAVKLIRV